MRLATVLLIAVLLAACAGDIGPAASPTPSPIDTYVAYPIGTATVYIEVTTTAALADFLKISGTVRLDALPGGSEITCHKFATVDNSPVTFWDDGTPDGKTFAQEQCNRK